MQLLHYFRSRVGRRLHLARKKRRGFVTLCGRDVDEGWREVRKPPPAKGGKVEQRLCLVCRRSRSTLFIDAGQHRRLFAAIDKCHRADVEARDWKAYARALSPYGHTSLLSRAKASKLITHLELQAQELARNEDVPDVVLDVFVRIEAAA